MSHQLVIPDSLDSRLERAARLRGLNNVEQLLEAWQTKEDGPCQRRAVVREMDVLQERLHATYGAMLDSTVLICEDRSRSN
jgi:hypothetical protein